MFTSSYLLGVNGDDIKIIISLIMRDPYQCTDKTVRKCVGEILGILACQDMHIFSLNFVEQLSFLVRDIMRKKDWR
jgi:hypothetical protein